MIHIMYISPFINQACANPLTTLIVLMVSIEYWYGSRAPDKYYLIELWQYCTHYWWTLARYIKTKKIVSIRSLFCPGKFGTSTMIKEAQNYQRRETKFIWKGKGFFLRILKVSMKEKSASALGKNKHQGTFFLTNCSSVHVCKTLTGMIFQVVIKLYCKLCFSIYTS